MNSAKCTPTSVKRLLGRKRAKFTQWLRVCYFSGCVLSLRVLCIRVRLVSSNMKVYPTSGCLQHLVHAMRSFLGTAVFTQLSDYYQSILFPTIEPCTGWICGGEDGSVHFTRQFATQWGIESPSNWSLVHLRLLLRSLLLWGFRLCVIISFTKLSIDRQKLRLWCLSIDHTLRHIAVQSSEFVCCSIFLLRFKLVRFGCVGFGISSRLPESCQSELTVLLCALLWGIPPDVFIYKAAFALNKAFR